MNNKSKNGDQVKGGRNSTGTTKNIIIPKKDVKLAELIGIILGAIAGYYGGWIESLIMRFVDIMLCIPTFFLILAVLSLTMRFILWFILLPCLLLLLCITYFLGINRFRYNAYIIKALHSDIT